MFDTAAWMSFLYYIHHITLTSCAHDDTICLHHYKLTISSHFIRQVAVLFRHNKIFVFAKWHLFWHVGYLRHQQQVDLWPFDLESGIPVTCEVGYLCTNIDLPKPLCSRLRPDVTRQTDRRQTKASLNASALWWRRHNNQISIAPYTVVTPEALAAGRISVQWKSEWIKKHRWGWLWMCFCVVWPMICARNRGGTARLSWPGRLVTHRDIHLLLLLLL